MPELIPTVDYQAIREIKELPMSWMSTHDCDTTAAEKYVRKCKETLQQVDSARVAELIGGEAAHFKLTILESGLRYVTIHLESGKQIFDTTSCKSIEDRYQRVKANKDVDLGDGFKLKTTISGHGKNYVVCYIEKIFKIAGNNVEVHYSIQPPSMDEDGRLNLSYAVSTPSVLEFKVDYSGNGSRMGTETKPIIAKHQEVRIFTTAPKDTDKSKHPHTENSIIVAHNLPNMPDQGLFDQMEFKFNFKGRLEEIEGVSTGANPNPEWSDAKLLSAIKKGENAWFSYNAQSPEAQVLSQAVFGQDVTRLQHNIQETLNALIEAAIKEMDIDPVKMLKFV